ncbi:MAG: polysaccharide deacetylase family protein [Chitinophagaceae bacterium]
MNRILFIILLFLISFNLFAQSKSTFSWPEGKEAAISLSFDDGRYSQVEGGTAFLDSLHVKATFYVLPSAVEKRLEGWKKAVAGGQEIGNHSLHHPCSGNFVWSKENALENYTLDSMQAELTNANNLIQKLLGVKPKVFAYPCGQKFVGRGLDTKSYVPLIAKMFITGRGFLEETANDPAFTDFAQITGIDMDGKNFEQILPFILEAKKNGQWVVLAGHEMGEGGAQTTRLSMLRKLIGYAQDPANKLWIEPVGTIAGYIEQHRK